jgi:Acetyltransferase (GNAT) domain
MLPSTLRPDGPTDRPALGTPGGYADPAYARSLAEFGAPRGLPRSRSWVLVRDIPGFAAKDARGCYPLFSCADWSRLAADLEDLKGDLVSLALVADPFGDYDVVSLRRCFPDRCYPYKEHHVIDLARPVEQVVLAGPHARNIKKARQQVSVEHCTEPAAWLDEWASLYANLVSRHGINPRAISAFSRAAFAQQLRSPGLALFRAVAAGETVGMLLWYVWGLVGYYHLGAYSDRGYDLRASFALFAHAIEFFAPRLRWLNLGAGAGVQSSGDDGLTRFKRGWATGTRTAYFCGRIFDPARYALLAEANGATGNDYFPIYRKGNAL